MDFNGFPTSATLIELQNALGIASHIARALDVLPVYVYSILGMMAKVGQRCRSVTDGP